MRTLFFIIAIVCYAACGDQHRCVEYYPNGSIRYECECRKTIPDGQCFDYYENGKLKVLSSWVNGKRAGLSYHYDSVGNLTCVMSWKNHKKDGRVIWFHPDGEREVANYKNDTLNGSFFCYDMKQRLRTVGTYIDGKIVGTRITYNQKGLLCEKAEFCNVYDQSVLNQVVCYTDFGDTLQAISLYYSIRKESDTVLLGDRQTINVLVHWGDHLYGGGYNKLQLKTAEYSSCFEVLDTSTIQRVTSNSLTIAHHYYPHKVGKNYFRAVAFVYRDSLFDDGTSYKVGEVMYMTDSFFVKDCREGSEVVPPNPFK